MKRIVFLLIIVAISLALPALGKLTGKVLDDQGRPVALGVVMIDSTSYRALTDLDGNFRIDGLPEGHYEAYALQMGYLLSSRVDFNISGSDSIQASFMLLPHEPRIEDPDIFIPGAPGSVKTTVKTPAEVTPIK